MFRSVFLVLTCLLSLAPMRLFVDGPSAPTAPATPETRLMLPFVSRIKWPTGFGVQMYGGLDDPKQHTDDALAGGVSWVRWPVAWGAVEPVNTKPSTFSFSSVDPSITRAAALQLHLIVTIVGNPSWAATYSNGVIDKVPLAEFAEFVQAMVERYDGDGFQDAPGSPRVDIWEFYNEPDDADVLGAENGLSYWGDFGREYAAMLCAAYSSAKAADPLAKIAIGGLAYDWFRDQGGPFSRTFLDDVLKNGGGRCMDFMNFHYYPVFQPLWDPYGHGLIGKANAIRSKLAAYGWGNLPMIITEAGHHSNPYPADPSSPQEQVNYVVRLFTQSFAAPMGLMIWWTWLDPAPQNNWGENGLLTLQGDPKPSYTAYRVAASKLGQARFVREVPASETGSSAAQVYEFAGGRSFYVGWVEGATSATISLPGSRFTLIDPLGTVLGYATDGADGKIDGRVGIDLSQTPRYVERTD